GEEAVADGEGVDEPGERLRDMGTGKAGAEGEGEADDDEKLARHHQRRDEDPIEAAQIESAIDEHRQDHRVDDRKGATFRAGEDAEDETTDNDRRHPEGKDRDRKSVV